MANDTDIQILEGRGGTCIIWAGLTAIRLDEDDMYELYSKLTDYLIEKGRIILKSEIEKVRQK